MVLGNSGCRPQSTSREGLLLHVLFVRICTLSLGYDTVCLYSSELQSGISCDYFTHRIFPIAFFFFFS